jgi:hypothetical protein
MVHKCAGGGARRRRRKSEEKVSLRKIRVLMVQSDNILINDNILLMQNCI